MKPEHNEINLLDYWAVLKRGRLFIAGTVFIVSVLAVVVSLMLPKIYKSSAVILPLGAQKSGGLASMVSQMGNIGGLLGGLGGANNYTSQIMAILKSRTLAEKVIDKADLMPVLFPDNWDPASRNWKDLNPMAINQEEAVRRLFLNVAFFEDKKNQTISISAEFLSPQVAAKTVNTYVEELARHISRNTFTSAKRNRIFIEGQLERSKVELLSAGKELASFYSSNRISNTMPTVDVDVGIEGTVASPESQPSPTVKIEDETAALMKQLDELNGQIEYAKVVSGVPQQVYLQYLTLRQELLGKVNALLTQQYELAKVEENKEDLTFQVVDWGRVPIRKFKPKRAQIALASFFASIFLSVLYVLGKDYVARLKAGGPTA